MNYDDSNPSEIPIIMKISKKLLLFRTVARRSNFVHVKCTYLEI